MGLEIKDSNGNIFKLLPLPREIFRDILKSNDKPARYARWVLASLAAGGGAGIALNSDKVINHLISFFRFVSSANILWH